MSLPERRPLRGLYAITPDWTETARLLAVTEAILRGGCRLLQYRHKGTSPCHRDEQAGALRRLTRQYQARLIINDDVELALAVDADGVHLGHEDGDLAQARARLGPDRIIGASCYQSIETARQAVKAGVDYVAFGSFFPSSTKPDACRVDLSLLQTAHAVLDVPIVAIGGITLDRARPLVEAGAAMLAVITALYETDQPTVTAQEFERLFA